VAVSTLGCGVQPATKNAVNPTKVESRWFAEYGIKVSSPVVSSAFGLVPETVNVR
tara:strand:+ start:4737 stop:4901 length:165 start_codon:yes stop_codon:yes gene_type:complete